ncbi:MAG TPA: SDR family oxidoreductase [Oligoflexia bacterium]|nr:SDR family oxidoreductase [Oligoflexia bacterium]
MTHSKPSDQSPKLSKKVVLITGSSGLLGATLLMELRDRYGLVGTYLTHPISLSGTTNYMLDLREKAALFELLERVRPEVIIHTAAAVNVDECETNRELAYQLNVSVPDSLSEYCGANRSLFVHLSTDAFFSEKNVLHDEESAVTPLNYYAETKLLAEDIIRKKCSNHLIIRTNFFGWNYQIKSSLAEWIYFLLRDGKTVPAVEDVWFTPILTNTLSSTLHEMIEHGLRGTYHVASDRSISKYEFAQQICAAFDFDYSLIIPTKVESLKLKAKRSSNMALSNRKLRRDLPGWQCHIEDEIFKFKELEINGYIRRLRTSLVDN